MSRDPRPVSLESCSMPSHHCLRFDENQRPPPSRPYASQHHPKQSIRSRNPWLRTPTFPNGKLLPKSQIFQEQIAAGTGSSENQGRKKPQQAQLREFSHEDDRASS